MDVVELIDWSPLSLHIATPPSQSRHNLPPRIDSGVKNSGQKKMEPENPTNEEYREQRRADNQKKKKKKRMGLTNSWRYYEYCTVEI